jgi:sarcosine oxidase
MRRVVHLRVTFGLTPAGRPAATSWDGATWADRSGRFGALTYGVADGPGRFALGLAELDAQPAPADPAADVVGPGVDLDAVRSRVHAYAREAFPGLGPPRTEVVRLLTVIPGDDEDAYLLEPRPGMTVVAGHNLFKLAPLLGEDLAGAAGRP